MYVFLLVIISTNIYFKYTIVEFAFALHTLQFILVYIQIKLASPKSLKYTTVSKKKLLIGFIFFEMLIGWLVNC